MPVYTLIPDEHDFEPEEISAADASTLLAGIHDFGWNAAGVFQDGRFVFTLARNTSGFWTILPGLPESDTEHAAEPLT